MTLTAQVTPAPRSGTVSFYLNGSLLGSAGIGRGSLASIAYTASSVGTFEVSAVYSGSATDRGSSSGIVLQVIGEKTATTTTLTTSPDPATISQPVTLTAQVSCATATGTMTFKAGNRVIGTTTVVAGQASVSVGLRNGAFTLTAAYSGDAACDGSTSAPLTLTVSRR